MNKDKVNPTSIKYEKLIIDSFTALLKTDSYDMITIQQIADEAKISRQTFYRHFKSKDEILELYSKNLTTELSQKLEKLCDKSIYSIFLCYFNFWMEKSYLLDIVKKSSGEYLLSRYYNLTMNSILDILRPVLPQYSDEDFKLIKSFLTGGLYQIKMQWQEGGYKETPEKLAQLVTNLF